MIPVDSLAPKARAIRVTIIMAMPLMPLLEIPNTKEAVRAMIQDTIEISCAVGRTIYDV
jgi:hypothetical protein